MLKPSFILLLCSFIFPTSFAVASVDKLDPQTIPEWKKGAFTFGAGLSTLLVSQFALKIPNTCEWCDPSAFDRDLSNNTLWTERKDAAFISDVIVYGIMPGLGALVAIYDFEKPSEAAVNIFTLVNTTLLNYSLTEVVKRSTARARPFAGDNPIDQNLSFVSGHTSMAFALSTASTWLAFKRHYNWAPFVAFLGGIAAVSTGYLRIAAGKHWFSDVIAGASLGLFTGSFVPLFAFANISPMPGAEGVMVSWNW